VALTHFFWFAYTGRHYKLQYETRVVTNTEGYITNDAKESATSSTKAKYAGSLVGYEWVRNDVPEVVAEVGNVGEDFGKLYTIL
jgi:hypothetical protein